MPFATIASSVWEGALSVFSRVFVRWLVLHYASADLVSVAPFEREAAP